MIQPRPAIKPYLISVFFMLFLLQNNFAASYEELVPRVSYWEFGFSGGFSKFHTSANPNADAAYKKFDYWNSKLNVGISLSAIKHISPVFSLEFNYLKTGLSGSWDANKGYPVPVNVLAAGLSAPPPYKTGINQISVMLNTNLNKLFFPKQAGDNWYLYFNAGAGFSLVKSKKGFDMLSGNRFKGMVLFGPGVSVKINKNMNGVAGFASNIVFTDRLDALHTTVTESNGNVKSVMNVNERYNYSYIGITYRFEKKVHKINDSSERYYKPAIERDSFWNKFFKHIF